MVIKREKRAKVIVLYLIFFPVLISLNEIYWISTAVTEIDLEIVMLFAIKGIIVEFILVALADALLLLPFVRKIFKLPESRASRANTKILTAMVLFGLLFTYLVLSLNQYISRGEISFTALFSSNDFARSTFLLATILFVLMGGITVRYVEKMLKIQEDLSEREKQYRLANIKISQLNETLEQKVQSRTQDLKQTNQELEEFAYTISHDLKSPLRAIDAYGEFLMLDHKESLDEDAIEMVNDIRTISHNLIELVNRLLEYSTMTKKELHIEPVYLFLVVEKVVKEFIISNPQKKIHVNFIGEDAVIMGDKILLTQVIQNLISNSVKFSDEMTQITFSRIIKDGFYHFELKDQGIGFENADGNEVFGIFQTMHKSHDYEGYGIGLATVRKIIWKHAGEVNITSTRGKGTIVSFTLPLRKDQEGNHV